MSLSCLAAALLAIGILPLLISETLAAQDSSTTGENELAHPNVLLILTDDQGFGDISSHDNDWLQTPHLDQLADAGARFDRFFVCPVCAPTRASLLSGRYHLRTGVFGVTRGQENMKAEEVTLAEILGENGYRTGCFGKWHNGAHYPMNPNGQGFEEFVGFCAGHWNNYFDTMLQRNGEDYPTTGYIADVLTAEAIRYIERDDDRPFFCYVAFNTPHTPWQVPDNEFQAYSQLDLDAEARCAYSMCANLDNNVGRLLHSLEKRQIERETIVIFLTDNGPNSNRFNGNMKGRKGSVHEGGVRVPCFIRYPGTIQPATTVSPISSVIDLLPTICELCQVDLPSGLDDQLDGKSLVPLLQRESWKHAERALFTFRQQGGIDGLPGAGAVRTERWRATLLRGQWSLFDMQVDPQQTQDLAKTHPDELEQLSRQYRTFLTSLAPAELQPLPIPLGWDQWPKVTLPAHEAVLVGGDPSADADLGIAYHGGQGWANDWIDRWNDRAAAAVWTVENQQAGLYRVSVRYAGDDKYLGHIFRCRIGDQSVSAKVERSCPLELVQSPDRIERKEVYEVKRWEPLDLGTIAIPAGKQSIRLEVDQLKSHAMSVKAIELTRVDDVNE